MIKSNQGDEFMVAKSLIEAAKESRERDGVVIFTPTVPVMLEREKATLQAEKLVRKTDLVWLSDRRRWAHVTQLRLVKN
jgi:hypothetical protein